MKGDSAGKVYRPRVRRSVEAVACILIASCSLAILAFMSNVYLRVFEGHDGKQPLRNAEG